MVSVVVLAYCSNSEDKYSNVQTLAYCSNSNVQNQAYCSNSEDILILKSLKQRNCNIPK